MPLRLHDWDVDWAAWCTYKYLNGGPGALAGAFVHERHLADRSLPQARRAGGAPTRPRGSQMAPDRSTRSTPPTPGSCPTRRSSRWRPVLASLEMFDEVGMDDLRERSVRLTGYLESLLDG